MKPNRNRLPDRDGTFTPQVRASGRRDTPWVPNNPLVPDQIETWWHGISKKKTAPAGEKQRKSILDSLDVLNAFRKGFQNSRNK